MRAGIAAAYSATGGAWEQGPAQVYDRLAEVLVARSPVGFEGRLVLDMGAGTGAATRAVSRAGARAVVALDPAIGMLRHRAAARPPAVVADALALPMPDASVDGAVAAFSLNHLVAPAAALGEMARVLRPGAPLLVSSYAEDDTHPVKSAVEQALRSRGWRPQSWYLDLRAQAIPRLATAPACASAAADAGLDASVTPLRVPFPDLTPRQLVAWRLGMAQHAPFLASLPAAEQRAVADDAVQLLGPAPPVLVRSILVLTACGVPTEPTS